jgi:hypothetical protein
MQYIYLQGGFTALYIAAQKCRTEVVRVLIREGADVNMRNEVRRPVVIVVVFYCYRVVYYLGYACIHTESHTYRTFYIIYGYSFV